MSESFLEHCAELLADALLLERRNSDRRRSEAVAGCRPENAVAFGVSPGTYLFSADCEKGVDVWLVVVADQDGYVKAIRVSGHQFDSYEANVSWGVDWHFRTEKEALEHAAKEEIAYCTPRLAWAKSLLDAIEKGADLAAFRKGCPDE